MIFTKIWIYTSYLYFYTFTVFPYTRIKLFIFLINKEESERRLYITTFSETRKTKLRPKPESLREIIPNEILNNPKSFKALGKFVNENARKMILTDLTTFLGLYLFPHFLKLFS